MTEILDGRQCRELVAAVQAGDRGAEERLVQSFGRGVALLLHRHTGSGPEAEDLYQETFRVAIEKIRGGDLREPEKVPAFLSSLARNLATEHYRKAQRRKTDPAGDDLPELVSTAPSQLDLIEDRESAALVRQVLRELRNDRDREILVRYYLADHDRETVANDLGLTSLQLNRVLHRARQRYKACFLARVGPSWVLLVLLATGRED